MASRSKLRRTKPEAPESHEWINYRLDLTGFRHTVWMKLGEARSKCDHISGVPLRPETGKQLHLVYLAKGVHATTAIEGNTLTEEQVQQQINDDLQLPESQQYLQEEIKNIIEACNRIARELETNPGMPLTSERVLEFHALVLRKLPRLEHVEPGRFRTCSVGVMNYRGAPWEKCPQLVERLCEWLNGPDFQSVDPDMRFTLAFIRAVLAHLYIAWIHPFGDGNGRTARLIEFQLLVQSGLPSAAAHLLSNHYNKTRSEYYRQLALSSKVPDGALRFIEYAIIGFVDGLREQLGYIREQQWQITWESHVHRVFKRIDGAPAERRRKLLLELPSDWTPRDAVESLTPRIARTYATLSRRTLERDLSALVEMDLLETNGPLVRPNRDLLLAFLPRRVVTGKGEG